MTDPYGYYSPNWTDEDREEEAEELEARLATLRTRQAPAAEPERGAAEPDRAAYWERLNAATTQEEAHAATAEWNAQVTAYNAPPPPPRLSQAELNERIANASSPDEVMALLSDAGIPNSADLRD